MIEKLFLKDSFLLQNDTAYRLYHEYAKHCPIIDYHCHLSPSDIASNRQYLDLTELWLEGDHYKWRAMRANGIDEKFITGSATNYEKFKAWAATVPYTLRNPLYHWTHLELKRYFNISTLLSMETAESIYAEANSLIATPNYRTRALLKKYNVEIICTSDDPVSKLEHHQLLSKTGFEVKVLPTWRPDPLLNVEDKETFNDYITKLEKSSDINIISFNDLLDAIKICHEYFHINGCRLADHGLNQFAAADFTSRELSKIFEKLRNRKSITPEQVLTFQSGMIYFLAIMNHEKNWTQQFHVGALRNTNTRLERKLGPNTGFDSIGSSQKAEQISRFFSRLDDKNQLASTIIYNNNPADNYLFAAMTGNFQDGTIPGKMQYGPAWWFLDQKEGIEMQINAISNIGLLSRFVGMVTDSRSFLSFPRHEYFRRILCNLLGQEIEQGLLPGDLELIGKLVKDICYNNAKNYFGFDQIIPTKK